MLVLGIGIMLNSFSWFLKLLYPVHYEGIVRKYANEYDLDPYLIFSIIKVESKFYEKAQSPKNARGLMQISPVTGQWASKELGISDYTEDLLFVPNVNIRIGCWYLDKLRKEFKGDWALILAAYNGGSGNVAKWLKDPEYSHDGKTLKKIPFSETKAYIEKVEKNYKIYKMLYK
ncbi:MAG TPA: lytic transglycosylase domain-containing protein [Clostridiales bacterium]|nr:lytic transglycosylase domain-containing protein [Clostridiales bacterium]